MGLIAFVIITITLVCFLAYDYLAKTIALQQLKWDGVVSQVTDLLPSAPDLNHDTKNNTLQDPITKLPGWKIIEDRLNQNINESKRYQFTLALMFIDLDNFKVINNALGFEIGNDVLHEAAKRLQTCVRTVDSIGRYDKDIFVAVLTQLSKPETAAIVAQRILQALEEPFHINHHELFLTASIGVALYPADGEAVSELLQSADEALHLAKEKDGHSYQFFQAGMHAQSHRTLALYTSLSRESIFKEFVPCYQPVMDVRTESVLAMDVSFNWLHETLGQIQASEIISVAEKQSKLNVITDWQLKRACQQFLNWQQLGFNPPFIGLTVMIEQLNHPHFIYQLSKIMQQAPFNPANLMVNITGSVTRLSPEAIDKAFNMLRYLGVKISVHDFGSGAFPLKCLNRLPVDYLKLDRAFTDDIVDNQHAQILLKSILAMAENMGMTSIAQSVESEQQLSTLKMLGCHVMQGYFLSAPLLENEIQEKMTEV